jgi:hypothetical protein
LGALLLPETAGAHTRSISYSSWRLTEDGARVKLRIPRLELTRVGLDAPPDDPALAQRAAAYLAARIALVGGGAPCERSGPIGPRRAKEGWAAFAWQLECRDGSPDSISTSILLDVAPSHLHFARVTLRDGRIVERLLTEADSEWSGLSAAVVSEGTPDGDSAAREATAEVLGSTLARYVRLGVEHILTGWDHLAFVLALLILAARLGEVARVVTGFTIAHSVTLALAVLGYVYPHAPSVEAVIGFSVALVAAENAWAVSGRGRGVPLAIAAGLLACAALAAGGHGVLGVGTLLGLALFSLCHFALLERSDRPARVRAALAFAFGLVHGFGFAGVLGEMQLPTERLVPALFGFNVGVELGQLATVAVVWPILRALSTLAEGRVHRLVTDAASAGICGIGLYWFVSRVFGNA